MGCVASTVDKEERVRICKERKKLMKQVLAFRKEFADAQLAYLRGLKNTGVTLRQFTESESLEPEDSLLPPELPPSPPPPLPPSPPPPPSFSPDQRNSEKCQQIVSAQVETIEFEEDGETPPPPPLPTTSWGFWDPFSSSPRPCDKGSDPGEQIEEENWEETNTEFLDGDEDYMVFDTAVDMLPEKQQNIDSIDDDSSVTSWLTKDTADLALVVSTSKRSLAGIARELDDYFLKASACIKDVSVLIDINVGDCFPYQTVDENRSKRSGSAKVFSSLTWSWSSKSLLPTKDSSRFSSPSEPCKPGAHRITLERLHAEEQKLHRGIKEEETMKLEYQRKSIVFQKQQDEDNEWSKAEKIRLSIETLQSEVLSLQESIGRTCSTILEVVKGQLHPQLVTLISGLMHMWQKMSECHQVQNYIAQQLNHLIVPQTVDPTTEYHRQAAAQLKNEVASWHRSFCKVIKFQREYVRALCQWIKLTSYLADDGQDADSSTALRNLSEEWMRALDKLPEKNASEAIKGVLSAVETIVLQQEEELNLQKRSAKLERKLQREMSSLTEMEMRFAGSSIPEDLNSVLGPKHPLSIKRAKIEALKKLADDEKARHVNSVNATHTMILNKLQTSLPNVFCALMGFSSIYSQYLEAVLSCATTVPQEDASPSPI